MHYVYFIENKAKNYLYVGSTANLKTRIVAHNNGKNQSTKSYIPLILSAYIAVSTDIQARTLEKYFKTGSGRAILKKRILQNEASA